VWGAWICHGLGGLPSAFQLLHPPGGPEHLRPTIISDIAGRRHGEIRAVGCCYLATLRTVDGGKSAAGVYWHGLGCCPLQLTVACRGRVKGSLAGGGGPRSWLAGSGFRPLLIDGAGLTLPGLTG
jgi:hypothetical protein